MIKNRLLELDGLRGLCALMVVAYHYFYHYHRLFGHDQIAINWSKYGFYGVNLFFMISGFVIFWTLNRVEKPVDFVVSRFSRLYPAYWCAVLITFTVVSFFGLEGREVSALAAIANLSMIQDYFLIANVDGVYWTLAVELTFYFWMFLAYLSGKLEKIEYFYLGSLVLATLQAFGLYELPRFLTDLLILKHSSFFVAGICFFKISNNGASGLTYFALSVSLLSNFWLTSTETFIASLVCYSVFYLVVSGQIKLLAARPFVFFGSISYTLYLIHQNIGYVIINALYQKQWHPLMAILVAFCTAVGLATLMSKIIERPVLGFIRRYYKGHAKMQRLANKLTIQR